MLHVHVVAAYLGRRPFVSRGYAMFVVSAEAITNSLQMDPGDSAIDRLFEAAQFVDSQGIWDLHFPGIEVGAQGFWFA